MEENEILINFQNETSPGIIRKTKSKGGRWRDRLSATRKTRRDQNSYLTVNQSKNPQDSIKNVFSHEVTSLRPVKRLKTSKITPKSVSSSRYKSGKDSRLSNGDNAHQVISSLFSFNPKRSRASADTDSEQDSSQKPDASNAPLSAAVGAFVSLGLSTKLAFHLSVSLGIDSPTMIQKESIPHLCKKNEDTFIQSETGSGKTLSYLLPIVQHIMDLSSAAAKDTTASSKSPLLRNSGLFAVILGPTRELCKQILAILEKVLRCSPWMVGGIVIGGEKRKSEKARLRKGLNLLVATPGRLADHLENTEALVLSNVRWLVLDEGDRLMELGFERDIRKIITKLDFAKKSNISIPGLPSDRTTIVCSATMKSNVNTLGEFSLRNATHIRVSSQENAYPRSIGQIDEFQAPAQLLQSYTIVPAKLRLVTLKALLSYNFAQSKKLKLLVFVSCASSVDFHFELFTTRKTSNDAEEITGAVNTQPKPLSTRSCAIALELGSSADPVECFRLHGNLAQHVRTSTLKAFRATTQSAFLICTDVASRGLDLPSVDLVVEYDPPFAKEDHIHRVGRTARAGKDGRALIFLLPGCEESYIDVLEKARQQCGRHLRNEVSDVILQNGFSGGEANGDYSWEFNATEWQLGWERHAVQNPEFLCIAQDAYQSHIRAYKTHVSSERSIFDSSQLHLGHLAKAFLLRDNPGRIRQQHTRQQRSELLKTKRHRSSSQHSESAQVKNDRLRNSIMDATDLAAARRIKNKMNDQMYGAVEFNIA